MKKIKCSFLILAVLYLTACTDSISFNNSGAVQSDITYSSSATTAHTEITEDSIIEKATQILNNMTAEQKVGQLFFVRCPIDTLEAQLNCIKEYNLGGYILFSEDFKNRIPEEVKKNIEAYQNASSLPLLIGIDEEGGDIVRISKYSAFREKRFESQNQLGKQGSNYIKNSSIEKAVFLNSYGINVNLAPVADVSVNPSDYIYNRTFGTDSKQTADFVKNIVDANSSINYSSVLKHFPGYGSCADTHLGIAVDERSYETFVNKDFLPFKAGIEAGADAVLVNHNLVKSIDNDYPASLSKECHRILREDLKFDGVIMTDDLSMQAIIDYADEQNVAVAAFEAGNDIILQSDFKDGYTELLAAVTKGDITEDRLNESVLRILKWKIFRGIIKI